MSLRPLLTTFRNSRPHSWPYLNAKPCQLRVQQHGLGISRAYALHAGTHRAPTALHSLTIAQRASTSAFSSSVEPRCSLSSSSWAYHPTFTKAKAVTGRTLTPCGTPTGIGRCPLPRRRACSTNSTPRSSTATTSNMSISAEVNYRLPTNVRPTHYDVTVRTDIPGSKFDGIVTVQYVLHMLQMVLLD